MRNLHSALIASVLAAAAWLSQQQAASAQQVPAEPAAAAAENAEDEFGAHFNVPDSPAANALGIARGSATPPSFMRRYAFELIDANEATGVAGEFSPYLLAISMRSQPGDRVMSATDYQTNPVVRNLARINASFAYTDGGSKADRAAFGLRWTIFNTRDPFMDRQFLNAVALERGDRANAGCAGRLLLDDLAQEGDESDTLGQEGEGSISDEERAQYDECRRQMTERAANSSGTALEFFAVQEWRSEEGGIENLDDAGTQFSVVLSHGFTNVANIEGRSQLLLALRQGNGVVVEDQGGALQTRDESGVALRLRFAPGENADLQRFNVSAEAEWSRMEYAAAPDQEQWRYTVGVEWRVAENTWLGLNMQDRSGDEVAGDDTAVGIQLRWGLRNEAPS